VSSVTDLYVTNQNIDADPSKKILMLIKCS
jgi:hypothetical protein